MNRLAPFLLPLSLLAGISLNSHAKDNDPAGDSSGTPSPKKKAKPTAAQCISHTTQARFVSGYDHLVHLKNKCEIGASCQVSSDVNPKPQSVRLDAHGAATVLTYRGSPARAFTAKVACLLDK